MILLISAVFPPEPVVSAFLTYDLAIALAGKSEIKVLCPRPSRPEGMNYNHQTQLSKEFDQVYLNSYIYPRSGLLGRMRESYSFGFHATKYIKKHHAAIKVIYMNAWPLLAEWTISRIAKKKRIPLIHHVQDIYPETLVSHIPFVGRLVAKLLLPIDNYILGNVAKVIVISKSMSTYLLKTRKIGPDKTQIIYNWQDEDPFAKYKAQSNSSPGSVFTFMYLGSLNQTASVHIFVKAIQQADLTNVRLVVAGDGYDKGRLKNMAKDSRSIEFWEAPKSKVPEIQDQADVLLLALPKNSARFALPSKLIAYMFSEKPVIACVDEDSEIAQVIMLSKAGWIVPADDIDSLISTMKKVINIPARNLQSMGKNGFRFASKYFSKRNNLKLLQDTIIQAAGIHNTITEDPDNT